MTVGFDNKSRSFIFITLMVNPPPTDTLSSVPVPVGGKTFGPNGNAERCGGGECFMGAYAYLRKTNKPKHIPLEWHGI